MTFFFKKHSRIVKQLKVMSIFNITISAMVLTMIFLLYCSGSDGKSSRRLLIHSISSLAANVDS